ncbi:Aldehyde dehydrogenase [Candidatus Izimaplasma bacterium HR1]|jgi:aldehyde dehydrogenase (NAD+)|uniref:aldehyde dehydrogenase n=1 Tax=Candidatus Izimoplasma sp. HR1 TaxID=1541959 RepID=UPI0004F6B492|nr:Aldehyde dehydrogenase [Candidatus Izimaplasma bacterium HR1]
MNIKQIVKNSRTYFKSHETLEYKFRKENLNKLRLAINKYEPQLLESLKLDLGKNEHESYMTEIGVVLKELTYNEKRLKKLMKPKRVRTAVTDFPGSSFRYAEPFGVVLIISPWNYPVNLTLSPLIGALTAGNTAIIKPSEFSINTSKVIEEMILDTFEEKYVKVIQGGVETNQELLDQKFDYIFFTGSTNVGKIVMEKASKHLTPISLELGGKSPVIVDKNVNIQVAAKRITFGKYLNSGQTCIAPDYLYVHKDIKEEFISEMNKNIIEFYGEKPLESSIYGSIINQRHFNRLKNYLNDGTSIVGGTIDEENLRIAPTLLDSVEMSSLVMKEEIFGPILPIISYTEIDEVIDFIGSRPKPLALYLFTENAHIEKRVLSECQFGGGCINDTVMHIASEYLPFGGVGESGMGSYHGAKSFETFSHYKSILKKRTWFDLPVRYAPYSPVKKKLIKRFLK